METSSTVPCHICGKQFKRLDPHLIRIHKVAVSEYLVRFPDATIWSEDQIKRASEFMQSGHAAKMGQKARGCKKPSLSISMKGNKRGLGSDRSAERERYIQQAKKQHSEGNFGTWDDERRKQHAEITAKRWECGSLKHTWKPRWHIELRSHLIKKGIAFQEEYRIPKDRLKGMSRFGKPFDFYIEDTDTLIELNGCFWHGCDKCYEPHHIQDRVKENDTQKKEVAIASGYHFLQIWEHDKDLMYDQVESVIAR